LIHLISFIKAEDYGKFRDFFSHYRLLGIDSFKILLYSDNYSILQKAIGFLNEERVGATQIHLGDLKKRDIEKYMSFFFSLSDINVESWFIFSNVNEKLIFDMDVHDAKNKAISENVDCILDKDGKIVFCNIYSYREIENGYLKIQDGMRISKNRIGFTESEDSGLFRDPYNSLSVDYDKGVVVSSRNDVCFYINFYNDIDILLLSIERTFNCFPNCMFYLRNDKSSNFLDKEIEYIKGRYPNIIIVNNDKKANWASTGLVINEINSFIDVFEKNKNINYIVKMDTDSFIYDNVFDDIIADNFIQNDECVVVGSMHYFDGKVKLPVVTDMKLRLFGIKCNYFNYFHGKCYIVKRDIDFLKDRLDRLNDIIEFSKGDGDLFYNLENNTGEDVFLSLLFSSVGEEKIRFDSRVLSVSTHNPYNLKNNKEKLFIINPVSNLYTYKYYFENKTIDELPISRYRTIPLEIEYPIDVSGFISEKCVIGVLTKSNNCDKDGCFFYLLKRNKDPILSVEKHKNQYRVYYCNKNGIWKVVKIPCTYDYRFNIILNSSNFIFGGVDLSSIIVSYDFDFIKENSVMFSNNNPKNSKVESDLVEMRFSEYKEF